MFSLSSLLKNALAGAIVSVFALSFYISSASLLFQGPLAPQLPAAIGSAVLGGALLALANAWRGSLPRMSVGAEPGVVPLLAGISAAVAAQSAPAAAYANTVVALACAGLAVGLAWWAAGRGRAGNLIRYVPYPVIAGFLGAAGWLIFIGGMGVAAGAPFGWHSLAAGTFDAKPWIGLAVGAALFLAGLQLRHVLFLPSAIVGLCLAFHAGFALQGLGVAAARERGWLMPVLGRAWPDLPFAPALLAQVEWGVVAQQAGLMVSVVIVATVSLLLSIGSVEVAFDEPADVNRDLRVLGLGNVVAVLAGGLVGGVSSSRSLMNRAAGAVGPMSGVFKALLCVAALLWGGPLIGLLPRPLVGGLLVFLGLGLLKAWVVDSRRRLTGAEYAMVLAMVAAAGTIGLLPAVGIGVLACCVMFAYSSARLSPVRRELPRAAWPSRIEYGEAQAAAVQRAGQRLRIVELQGVLFFGSVARLVQRVERDLAAGPRPDELLLDFRHVPAIDTSAAQGLGRLLKLCGRLGLALRFSGLTPELRAALAAAGVVDVAGGAHGVPVHADVDAAVAAWDERVLAAEATEVADEPALLARLAAELGSQEAAQALLGRFEPIALAPGERLFAQGDAADALYLVTAGRLAATVERDGRSVEVRTLQPGSALGEMGLLREMPRSATLQAAEPSRVLKLPRSALQALEQQSPALAIALYRLLMRQLAGRLEQANAQAHALSHPTA